MLNGEVEAIWKGAAALVRTDVRTLELSGPDRVRFLNGMVSNDVAALAAGAGVLAVKTSSRGRCEALLRVRALESALALDLSSVVAERTRATLEQYIIMDDCAVRDASDEREVVSIFGPRARATLEAAGLGPVPAELADHAFVAYGGVVIIRDAVLGLRGYELHVAPKSAAAVLAKLEASGAAAISADALEVARIEAGTPVDGRDLDDDTIPMEARLERAISLQKGCYIGQEVIARATNLGQVKHILIGLRVEGDTVPKAGSPILPAGLPADRGAKTGEVTSAARSPTLGAVIALGYVRRAHEPVGTELLIDSGGTELRAAVVELPFVRAG